MKRIHPITRFLTLLFILTTSACAAEEIPTPTATPSPTPICNEAGSVGGDHVADPTHGFDSIYFDYYLPPCYENLKNQRFPVMYLMTLRGESALSPNDNTPFSLAERLIHAGKLPPVILIVPGQLLGYGSDTALTKDLVPYVDRKFRTLQDRQHRVTGGISNGAAVAVRMAFQYPETFSSTLVLSGGLSEGELDRFEGWIKRMPPDTRPRVRIEVGKQDAILEYVENLQSVLDRQHVRYTLNITPGNHDWDFWSSKIEDCLLWLAGGWS